VDVRPWPVVVVLLVGCDGVPREYRAGQALSFLGQEPWRGLYNPHLAGCTLTETDVTFETVETLTWDDRGRQTARVHESADETYDRQIAWDGPCVVREHESAASTAWSSTYEYLCDEQGWPVASTQTGTDADGAPTGPYERTWENGYDEDVLVQIDDSMGMSTTFSWLGRRLSRREITFLDGSTSLATFDYTDAGWIREIDEDGELRTFVYDIRGRLTRETRESFAYEWAYASDKAEHPGLRSYVEEGGGELQTELVWDCP
jgi:YD repeat-containing protein